MGKSLNGKELGNGISQRKDGLYQARFINRFGKRQTIYAKTLNEVRHKLRTEQYNDEKAINVVDKNMTLNEWFDIWLSTCKKNCRSSTKGSYITHYKRIQEELGWRKLTSLNLIVMQEAFNKLKTDNARKNSKKILVDMLNKAVDTDLLVKNVAKQINTVIAKEEKKERRVLTIRETELFLEQAKGTFYENLFILALETGLRVGELSALQWALGRPLLEEQTPEGIGNYAAILSDPEYNDAALLEKLKNFLEDMQWEGFANMDIKYDARTGEYKMFEMNPRQGRSSYFVTAAGYNLSKWLVEDVLEHKELGLTIADTKSLWMIAPYGVIKKYLKDPDLLARADKLKKEGKCAHQLFCKEDWNLKRWLWYIRSQLNYYRKTARYYGNKGLRD